MSKNPVNQTNEEHVSFKTFVEARPDFAGEVVAEWVPTGPSYDPADVI